MSGVVDTMADVSHAKHSDGCANDAAGHAKHTVSYAMDSVPAARVVGCDAMSGVVDTMSGVALAKHNYRHAEAISNKKNNTLLFTWLSIFMP